MDLEKVVFGFFIALALTVNFGFFLGEIDNPMHHNVYELFAAIIVTLIANRFARNARQPLYIVCGCLPLLLKRGNEIKLLPPVEDPLQADAQILFCGDDGNAQLLEWPLQNVNTLRHIISGEPRPDGYIWRWRARRQQ